VPGVKIMVVGVGNEERGDDAAGLMVARGLREKGLSGVGIHELPGDATSLLEIWNDAEAVYLVDAAYSGAAPGTLHRFEAAGMHTDTNIVRFSTHTADLTSVVELGRVLGQLPRRIIVFGIEGTTFAVGEGVSLDARRGIEKAIAAIMEEIQKSGGT
jgi:hydrogenase maturation protease